MRARHARSTSSTTAIGEDALLDALRQRADLAVGRAEDPVAEAQPAGDFRAGPPRSSPRPPILVHRLTGALRHRPLLGGELRARSIVVDELDWSDELAARHHRARAPAATSPGRPTSPAHVTPRRRAETGLAPGTPVIVGTIDAAAEALSVGVARAGRHDADVRLDHLHHHADREPRPRSAALVCAVALPGPARLDGRAGDQRHADPLVPRAVRARARPEAAAIATLAAEARTLAARRQGPGRASLFLGRAHADPRSARQGRDLRPQPHP